jgi:hypothetical protein
MGPAGEWNCFQVNLPVHVTDGAVIFTIICCVSIDLREHA